MLKFMLLLKMVKFTLLLNIFNMLNMVQLVNDVVENGQYYAVNDG